MDGYFLASDTDLLINWLYNLSIFLVAGVSAGAVKE